MAVLTAIDVDRAPEKPITVGYDLAAAYDDPLLLMYVMPEGKYQDRRESREDLPDEFADDGFTIDQATDVAAELAAECIEEHLETFDRDRVETLGRVGPPAAEIIAATEEVDPRFVVVGGRQRSPVKQAIFGSVSQPVMRKTEQPVVALMEAEE